jgi:hypothetical protein
VRTFLLTTLAVGFLAACVTPVIPMPPPDPSLMRFEQVDPTKGEVVLSMSASDPHGGTLIHIFHPKSGKGQILQAKQDGSFVSDPIKAAEGDQLEIWSARFVAESEPSSVVCIVVRYVEGGVMECPKKVE